MSKSKGSALSWTGGRPERERERGRERHDGLEEVKGGKMEKNMVRGRWGGGDIILQTY